jgi:hypothetical protein
MISAAILAGGPQSSGPAGAISAFNVNDGGSAWFVSDTYTVTGGDGLAAGIVDTVNPSPEGPSTIAAVHQGGGTITITAVNQGLKTFLVTGDWTAELYTGAFAIVAGSTGNNGTYLVTSSIFAAGSTTVTVTGAIPSATADGTITDLAELTVTGDHVAGIQAHATLISGSTGNDGRYLSSTGVLVSGDTKVQLFGTLPSAVADGTFTSGGQILTTHLTAMGSGYSIASAVSLVATGVSIGANALINITAVT